MRIEIMVGGFLLLLLILAAWVVVARVDEQCEKEYNRGKVSYSCKKHMTKSMPLIYMRGR